MVKQFESLNETQKVTIGGKTCYVSKIPVFYAQRILMMSGDAIKQLDFSLLPEQAIRDLLSYAAIDNPDGEPKVLDDIEVINLLVPSPKDLLSLELKMIEYNFGFFFDGSLQEVFAPILGLLKKSAETSTH